MKTLILGASTNPERYSYQAVERLLFHGHPIIALGNRPGEILGNQLHTEKIEWSEIDTISLYLGPQRQEEYYDYIFSLQPRRVLFNPGTENPAFEKKLVAQGIGVERACTLVLLATNQY